MVRVIELYGQGIEGNYRSISGVMVIALMDMIVVFWKSSLE